MCALTKNKKLEIIIDMCAKHDITAYEIGKHTNLNTSGVQRILNKEVKKPHESTLDTILEYIEKKIIGTQLQIKSDNVPLIKEPNQYYNNPAFKVDTKTKLKMQKSIVQSLENQMAAIKEKVKLFEDQIKLLKEIITEPEDEK